MVPLAGPEVLVRPPQPGTRIEVHTEPGQSIQLGGVDFAAASYLVVEGGLLVITEDGRQVYLSNFVDAAHSGTPPTLSVAGGPAVATDQLLANLQPIGEPAEGGVVGRLPPPEVGPLHGGGAGFDPYDPGNIGPGLEPTGPLQPAADRPRRRVPAPRHGRRSRRPLAARKRVHPGRRPPAMPAPG